MTVTAKAKDEKVQVTLTATLWVCDNCGDYYGAATAGDLHESWNYHHNRKTFRRSRCPTPQCARAGIHRRPINVDIPLVGP